MKYMVFDIWIAEIQLKQINNEILFKWTRREF